MTDIIDRLNDSLSAGYSELRKEAAVEIMRLRNAYYALLQERDALRAKIEHMEQQVPICRAEDLKHAESLLPTLGLKPENPLYALPGAHPAPSVPDDIVREVLRDCCGTFHGSRHRITCEKYKGKRDQETSCEDE